MALDQVEDIDRLAEIELAKREGRNPTPQDSGDMSFIDHIDAMRWHIIRAVIAVFVFTIIAFIFNGYIFDYIILAPTKADFYTYQKLCALGDLLNAPALCITDLPEDMLYNRKMTGQFTIHVTSSLIAGIIVAFPYVFWEIWRFIKPALYNTEKSVATGTTLAVSLLFFTGVLFGYFVISPLTYNFFVHYSVSDIIHNEFDLSSYISIVTNMVLVCGLMFQLPVVSYFLGKVGLLSPELMASKRKHAVVIILFAAAIFTPSDVFSQLLVAIPLFFLYQISIFVVRISYRRYKKNLNN